MGSKGRDPAPTNPVASINALKVPSIGEQMQNEEAQNWVNYLHAKGPRDAFNAPGMSEAIDFYGTGESLAAEDRLGNPARALSGAGSGDFAKQSDELGRTKRYNQRAGALSQAYNDSRDRAFGYGNNAAGLKFGRENAAAGYDLANYNSYQQRQALKVPWWKTALQAAIGGASAVAKGGA